MNERADPGHGLERGDELDRRIDAALRRRFEPPDSLATLAQRALPPRPMGRRLAPWLVLAAAAAAAALLVPWKGAGSETGTKSAPQRAERVAQAPDHGAPVDSATFPGSCRQDGPLEPPGSAIELVHSPDLARFYSAMDACQRSAASLPCSQNDGLAAQLRATYGAAIELRPDALGFLQGPFASADLPTATILTGFADNHTSVLVAERDSTLECCVCMDLPEESGLRMFTWQVGDLVLTEITPLAEPRLLEFFE